MPPDRSEELRRRKRSTSAIRQSLRELRVQLALLNHRIGDHLELKDVDLDCLDLITLHGPLSPSALARRAGLHPATVTGILDRLEEGGWVTRERDPGDRRAVRVRARHTRNADIMRLYSGMSNSINEILARYDNTQLDAIAEFLELTAHAGQHATDELADQARKPTTEELQ